MIYKLIKLTESKLEWGTGESWSTQDFEAVSEKILKDTGINLSVTTLKRLWGKIKYDSKPTVTTLNALAKFNGFDNWRSFQQIEIKNQTIIDLKSSNPNLNNDKRVKVKRKAFFFVPLLFLIITSLLLFLRFSDKSAIKKNLNPDDFSFSVKKILYKGVPNSVIFNYDAAAADISDTVEIQQSWDTRLRAVVDKDKKIHKTIYYYPGYFIAKLVVADSILKEHGVLIKTDGWLTIAERDLTKPPVYFNKEDAFTIEGVMTLPMNKILEKNISYEPTPMWTSHYNINDFGDIKSDNFIFETKVRNDYADVAGVCQYIQVFLSFEGVLLQIPLSSKGCVSNLTLYDIHGQMDVDTSNLGFESQTWVKIKVEVIDGNGKIYINDKYDYTVDFRLDKPAKFLGIQYNFEGTGSVDYTKLTNNKGDVFINEDY